MPTPIGHGLAGLAAGWAVAGAAPAGRSRLVQAAAFALLGAAADLDLLVHRHSSETHSLGAAVLVATVLAWGARPSVLAATRGRVWMAACAAWLTHPLLDALALDTSAPLGVMALWPLSSAHMQTGLSVFASVLRSFETPGMVSHNLLALLREVAILGPILFVVWIWRGRFHVRRRQ